MFKLWCERGINLDPDEHVIFIYDGAPAHRNAAIPGPNSELRKLPPYTPFLNIVEQGGARCFNGQNRT